MKKGLLVYPTLILFLILSFFLIYSVEHSLTANPEQIASGEMAKVEARNTVSSPIANYYAQAQVKNQTLAAIGKSDSRPVIINNFLANNNSPMTGLGETFVIIADKYGLDYRLIPAIAFQESTLGKRMPKGSHNAFGWAIYTGATSGAKFHNWEQAIDSVARGLKVNYLNQGLKTPEAIMTRYSPDSDGSWAFGVNFAINEMSAQ